MKKAIVISLFIFWSIVAIILIDGLFLAGKNSEVGQPSAPANSINPGLSGGGEVVLTAAEIAKHNSISDCWMIIDNKVYSLASYFSQHPGGVNSILSYCGKDGTVAFQTKDIGRPHSSAAQDLLANYYIGNPGQTIGGAASSGQNNQPTVSSPASGLVVTPKPTVGVSSVALTLAEVAKHNSAGNCWMIIGDKVYNFTAYISGHPGGNQMVPYCGKDGTISYNSGPPHAHSSFANGLLINYLLGNLNATVTTAPTPIAAPASSSVPGGGESEEEDDD
jgi:cytochrome b involved in lipid metabolism